MDYRMWLHLQLFGSLDTSTDTATTQRGRMLGDGVTNGLSVTSCLLPPKCSLVGSFVSHLPLLQAMVLGLLLVYEQTRVCYF